MESSLFEFNLSNSFRPQEWRDMESEHQRAEVVNIIIAWIITFVVVTRLT